jgi:uncharacterized protein YjbJ (UPF0337 family)
MASDNIGSAMGSAQDRVTGQGHATMGQAQHTTGGLQGQAHDAAGRLSGQVHDTTGKMTGAGHQVCSLVFISLLLWCCVAGGMMIMNVLWQVADRSSQVAPMQLHGCGWNSM